MLDELAGDQAGHAVPVQPLGGASDAPAEPVEATMRSVWRRVLTEGGGPELALDEAARMLGSSVDSVRRRIDAGHIQAFNDARGRIRISATVTYAPDGAVAQDAMDSETLPRLWTELKALREQLDATQIGKVRLQEELEAAEKALEYTKAEVANLWQVLTSRNLRQAARKATEETHTGPKVLDLAKQRARIRSKVDDMRSLARRRKWPWIGMVG